MPDIPPAPPSPPLRMPNSDLSTDAYAEDETLKDIVIHPEDSASATTPFRPRITLTIDWRQRVDKCYIGCFVSLSDVSTGLTRKRTSWVWQAENGEEYAAYCKMGNFDGNAEDVNHHHLQFARHQHLLRSQCTYTRMPLPKTQAYTFGVFTNLA
jgi:hypothetical protein